MADLKVFQIFHNQVISTRSYQKIERREIVNNLLRGYASGSVGSGEWGLVWLKKVLETRSHSTPLLRDGI